MPTFDPNSYPPVIGELLREQRLAPLGPGSPNQAARPRLQALRVDTAFAPRAVQDADIGRACVAGLWLYHDFLDESHALSQEIATPSGSYWHGLMHRREPDAANAAYWFRRVGEHPVFEPLRREAARLAAAGRADPAASFLTRQTAWDPFAFIDLCERSRGGTAGELLCRQVQQREWELLFDYCYHQAVGAA